MRSLHPLFAALWTTTTTTATGAFVISEVPIVNVVSTDPRLHRIGPGGYARALVLGDELLACTSLGSPGGGRLVVYAAPITTRSGGSTSNDVEIGEFTRRGEVLVGVGPAGGAFSESSWIDDTDLHDDIANCVLYHDAKSGLLAAYRHHRGCSSNGPEQAGSCASYSIRVSRAVTTRTFVGGTDGLEHDVDLKLPGERWEYLSEVHEDSVGCWEPTFFRESSGTTDNKLWLAYSQEFFHDNGKKMQSIVWQYSEDHGESWSRDVMLISDGADPLTPHGAAGGSRDGMPGIVQLPDGSLITVFEGFWNRALGERGWGHFTVQYRRRRKGGDEWDGGEVVVEPEMREVGAVCAADSAEVGNSLGSGGGGESYCANAGEVEVAVCSSSAEIGEGGEERATDHAAPPAKAIIAHDDANEERSVASPAFLAPQESSLEVDTPFLPNAGAPQVAISVLPRPKNDTGSAPTTVIYLSYQTDADHLHPPLSPYVPYCGIKIVTGVFDPATGEITWQSNGADPDRSKQDPANHWAIAAGPGTTWAGLVTVPYAGSSRVFATYDQGGESFLYGPLRGLLTSRSFEDSFEESLTV